MRKSQAQTTTAKNLEENRALGKREMAGKAARAAVERCGKQLTDKFDRGEDVLGYFDVRKARVINPKSKGHVATKKFAYSAKQNSRRAVVREKSVRYRKKR